MAPKAGSRRGAPRSVRPPPRQPGPCQPWPLPGRGMKHHLPDVSAHITAWQLSQACGPEDMQEKTKGHQPDPDVPCRAHQTRPCAIPGVPPFPQGPHPAICGMAFHRDPRLLTASQPA